MIEIPGYTIGDKIGEGGFAKVYLAEQVSLQRDVALKVVDPELVKDQQFCDRFIKEGRIIAKLSEHPNIITIHDIGNHQDCYYMSMEFVGGGTLRDKIRGEKPFSSVDIIRDIAGALSEAHAAGFIHRDIKPANILFKNDGTPVLTDFGIAKSVSGATQLTQAGFAVGTPDYMSPEQAMSKDVDGRADLYSLGVMFYELLVGEKPFTAEDAFSIAVKHINEPPPPLPQEHAAFQPLLDKLLAKSPDERFASAEEFIEALDEFSPSNGGGAATVVRPAVEVDAKGTKSWLPAALGVGGALVAAGVAFFVMQPGGQPESEVTEPEAAAEVAPTPPLDMASYSPKVQRLLNVGMLHEEFGRIASPPGSNACEAYELVLENDPGNRYATDARKRIGCE